jgi:hypothetical protein
MIKIKKGMVKIKMDSKLFQLFIGILNLFKPRSNYRRSDILLYFYSS